MNGIKADIKCEVPNVVTVPDKHFKKQVEEIEYDKSKTKLIVLDSFKGFDFTLIK